MSGTLLVAYHVSINKRGKDACLHGAAISATAHQTCVIDIINKHHISTLEDLKSYGRGRAISVEVGIRAVAILSR